MTHDEEITTQSPLKADPVNKPASKRHAPAVDKGEVSEFAKTAILAVLLALVIRTFLYEPFNIPSGSMMPTLLVG
ncbi:MAG TPA: S26 family signal peptidase, partial [Alphaproteobacteria bacterium]|nr:S26 family signal peptidase [Alphaproteobacteria bacterium]